MSSEVSLVGGSIFAVSDDLGDIAGGVCGFFAADTRLISTYVLKINGKRLLPLSFGLHGHEAASFYLTNPQMDGLEHGSLTVVRERHINGGLRDDLAIFNYSQEELSFELTIELSSDFADIFEVRGAAGLGSRRTAVRQFGPGALSFLYCSKGFERCVTVSASGDPENRDSHIVYPLKIAAKDKWQASLTITAGEGPQSGWAHCMSQPSPPILHTKHEHLRRAWHTAIGDLAALRVVDEQGLATVAAGLPWFMTTFGRDSLIAAFQTLVLGPEVAEGTLKSLASYQGQRVNPFNCEEPGKIPHEIRNGELAHLGLIPFRRYYGTVDATPLYLVLLSEVCQRRRDPVLFRELLTTVEAALEWLDRYGDVDGDGFVEYVPQLNHGLYNQGWKDSHDAILFADGRTPDGPIALCEVQGYVYDAKIRLADLYREIGASYRAAQLRDQAAALRRAFNDAFWMPDEGYFALALDGKKNQVNSITSNPGHCLWSGIVDEDLAEAVAERLLSKDMFNGWGVRTLSSEMRAYNPISYHNGSVWPHDCSIIAAGLVRYGFKREAELVIRCVTEASRYFPQDRLPELFAGYPRQEGGFPVRYPGANSPQAWASGAVILMVQLLLDLAPETGVLEYDLKHDQLPEQLERPLTNPAVYGFSY